MARDGYTKRIVKLQLYDDQPTHKKIRQKRPKMAILAVLSAQMAHFSEFFTEIGQFSLFSA
ncbi:MAG: hypothetical protein EOM20_06415 [Spartobacteria bacterium]|nr:hypothetical protein [Spartobacteria bacterium]